MSTTVSTVTFRCYSCRELNAVSPSDAVALSAPDAGKRQPHRCACGAAMTLLGEFRAVPWVPAIARGGRRDDDDDGDFSLDVVVLEPRD